MSADRDTTRIVRSWLRTDEHESADRVLDTVLALLDATPQRRSWWPARRIVPMNAYAKLAIVIAVVAVVAVAGVSLFSANNRLGGIGGPAATPSTPPASATVAPTPLPTASPTPSAASSPAAAESGWTTGPLATGPHHAQIELCDPRGPRFGCAPDKVAFSFDLPSDQWSSRYEGILEVGTFPDSYAWMWFMGPVHTVGTDPCAGKASSITPTVDGLAQALTTINGTDAVGPTDITVGGIPGKLVELTIHDDIPCAITDFYYLGDVSIHPNAIGSTIRLRIIDVNGSPMVVYSDQTNAELEPQIEHVVDSIRFD
jgi:hypothetical protein